MFLSWPCAKCEEILRVGTEDEVIFGATLVDMRNELNDSGVYHNRCTWGHEQTLVLSQDRHTTLFDIGLCALVDGYYREAILSIYGAAERFFECWVEVVLRHKKVSADISTAIFRKNLRLSERQYGAFVSIYVAETATVLKFPKEEVWTKMRNSVVHQGLVPDRAQVIAFAETTYEFLAPLSNELRSRYPEAVAEHIRNQDQIRRDLAKGAFSIIGMGSALSLHNDLPDTLDIEEIARATWYMWGRANPVPKGVTIFRGKDGEPLEQADLQKARDYADLLETRMKLPDNVKPLPANPAQLLAQVISAILTGSENNISIAAREIIKVAEDIQAVGQENAPHELLQQLQSDVDAVLKKGQWPIGHPMPVPEGVPPRWAPHNKIAVLDALEFVSESLAGFVEGK